jgi:hypothetical protein
MSGRVRDRDIDRVRDRDIDRVRDRDIERVRDRDIERVFPHWVTSQCESQWHLLGARCRGSWALGAQTPDGSRCCNRSGGARPLHTLVCGTVKGTDGRTVRQRGWVSSGYVGWDG